MIEELASAISLPFVVASVIAGLGLGVVVRWLRPGGDPEVVGFLAVVFAAFWYIPQAMRVAIAPETSPSTAARFLGSFLVMVVCYIGPMFLVLVARRR